jgi:hypothetical protein
MSNNSTPPHLHRGSKTSEARPRDLAYDKRTMKEIRSFPPSLSDLHFSDLEAVTFYPFNLWKVWKVKLTFPICFSQENSNIFAFGELHREERKAHPPSQCLATEDR